MAFFHTGERQVKVRQFALIAVTVIACNCAAAADITVVSTIGTRGLLEQVRKSFEHSSGDHLDIEYDFAPVLKRRLDTGGRFDVAILPQAMIDDLANQGKVVAATSITVARSGLAIAVRPGTAKSFIGTRDALRSVLLASSGVAYTTHGLSGVAVPRLFDALGIAKPLEGRIYLDTRPAGGVLAVAEGKAQMGLALAEEIAADPRVELLGRLPRSLQSYVVFGAAMASRTKEPDACRAFIAFLRKPDVRRRLRKVGMESG